MKINKNTYSGLVENIGIILEKSRTNAIYSVNVELVKANWEIGRHIVEYEQKGNERAEYGTELLAKLSKDLKMRYGKGFGRRNLLDMRRFFIVYPIWQTLSAKLSWSHYIVLLSISDELSRKFYENQGLQENWSVRELERQIDSSLFERLALSRNKKGILKLSKSGNAFVKPDEIIKDPYILDFLKIPQQKQFTEKQLEQKIIDNLQLFLLELGKGFAFIARQYSIPLRNKHFRIDLVFYHRILKCFVLIDLKIRPAKHTDIGQMNMYLNYFKTEENVDGDNNPIGIILTAEKDEVMVEYATGGITNKIFVSKYQLYLPDKTQIRNKIESIIQNK
ncbi:MAG: hypothetical protein A2X08_06490 [Bacteroidetes bacterium GWA2_32_17]|nr:MAG: hypothetical protein A2X08_06490 [Bacteroidetes bacterium GWA2_32_17]